MEQKVSPLVTPSWLSNQLSEATRSPSSLCVLDVTWNPHGKPGLEYYLEGHIPGSLYFDLQECRDKQSPYRVTLPSPGVFEDYVSKLGTGNTTHVVVYENDPGYKAKTAERVWWMFRYFGHDRVSVLDGGLQQWISEGYPVTSEETKNPPKCEFKASERLPLKKSYEAILQDLKEGKVQLVDSRPPHWFDGTKPSLWPNLRLGTIRNSVHVPFTELLEADSTKFKSPKELQEIFASKGIDLSQSLTTTCNVGVTACIVAMALYLLGKEDVAIFDGSWDEFSQKAPDDLLQINTYTEA